MATRRILVPPDQVGSRADVFVARALGISRRAARALLESRRARLRGHALSKGSVLTEPMEVEIEEPEEAAVLVPAPELELPVVYADREILVVDKPAGMPTHPLSPGERGSAANALVARFPELASVGPPERGARCIGSTLAHRGCFALPAVRSPTGA
jgi:23S rRNA pseudouridine1911/1915/1917 synthase